MPLSPELAKIRDRIRAVAKGYGLDFFEVVFELLDWNQMNVIASYGGFPNRYPHWRFGMEYEHISKSYAYGLTKIYEMVINNDPCYAYLLHSNNLVDQKMVMAHVYAHSDFFKNNRTFEGTNRKMIDEMGNHRAKIGRLVNRLGFDRVEDFIDRVLSIENLVNLYAPRKVASPVSGKSQEIRKIRSKDYMDSFINPKEFLDSEKQKMEEARLQEQKIPPQPERDILQFLVEYAPFEDWEAEILSIIREEALYFAPQAQSKLINEGWACVAPGTAVYTGKGLMPMSEVVQGESDLVSDGQEGRDIYDRHVIRNCETVTIHTRRGLMLTGSVTHRILTVGRRGWERLDQLKRGDRLIISGGNALWPPEEVPVFWSSPRRLSLEEVAQNVGVSLWTVLRYRKGRRVRKAEALAEVLDLYEAEENQLLPQSVNKRVPIRIPSFLTSQLSSFLGYLVGDGHISRVKRHLGLTTGDTEQASAFAQLVQELFGLRPLLKRDGNRWRVLVYSEALSDYLQEALGLLSGPSAREKQIPAAILRSPEPVVRSFLRSYFDCDGYAGSQGVILSTSSDVMSHQVQLLLLNYGILSRRRKQQDGCWHVHVTGKSARHFAEKIGFGLSRKMKALTQYLSRHRWFLPERWEDEVLEVRRGKGDVYDISVSQTHCYAAAGFINHNSFWHSKIMTEKVLQDSEIIDYADHHSGTVASHPGKLNPYKIGSELFRDIEERWDKGRFGPEYEQCPDLREKLTWDTHTGLGRKKIFEVRSLYNDLTFLDSFLTEEFCRQQKLFVYGFNSSTGTYEIIDRDFAKIRAKLLQTFTNMGNPIISVTDGNTGGRGELSLRHAHEGIDLKLDWAWDTLKNLYRIWKRPVHIETVIEGIPKRLSFDGEEQREQRLT